MRNFQLNNKKFDADCCGEESIRDLNGDRKNIQ